MTRIRLTRKLFKVLDAVNATYDPYRLQWVKIASLHSIQTWTRQSGVEAYRRLASFPSICVVKHQGKLIVRDGYHRIASCQADGLKKVLARVYLSASERVNTECVDCHQQLTGVMETDGTIDLLDLADLEECTE